MSGDSDGFERLVSRRELAELAGVERPTVTTWASRHPDFPEARSSGGQEYLHLPSILTWLDSRAVPARSLRDGENEGTTYADRIRRALRHRHAHGGRSERVDDDQAERRPTELFGPLADRVRGTGPQVAYLFLVLSLVSIRGSGHKGWGRIRDLVTDADRQQRNPSAVLRDLGAIVDEVLRGQGQMPGTVTTFQSLRPEAPEDLAYVVRLCEGLGRKAFGLLLDRFEEWTKPDSTEFFTPRGVVNLMADMLCADGGDRSRCYDPYVRGGEGLVAMAERLGDVAILGESPHPTSLQLAWMNLAFHGMRPTLRESTATPWESPDRHGPKFDFVIANPPFNRKVSVPRERAGQEWPFGPPPERSDTYAWLQFIHSSLAPGGRAAVVMPNRAAISEDVKERAIRAEMIRRGVVECVVRLPRGLFPGTPIAVTIWVLTQSGATDDQVLLIDARKMGRKEPDWGAIVACHRRWKNQDRDFSELEGGGVAVSVPRETIHGHENSLDPTEYAEALIEPSGPGVSVPRPATALDEALRQMAAADSVVDSLFVRERVAYDSGLPDGWRRVPLAELCDIQTGPTYSRLKAAPRSPEGVPIVVSGHLRDRRVKVTDPVRLDPTAARRFSRFALEADDILCVRTGSTGPVALASPEYKGCVFDTRLTRLRRYPSADLDPGYLLAFLSLPASGRWIGNRAAAATAIDSIGGKRLGYLLVTLPPLGEQRRIGAVLRAMDDQITAHREVAEAAEQTRAALAADLITGPLTLD